jgi:MoxR-like ATPase
MFRQKMLAVIADIETQVIERGELVHCIALALLTKKNLFVLGDTGQAKSCAVNEFCKRITGARKFEEQMSKQTDEDQLFGRLDLASIIPGNVSREVLAADGEYAKILNGLAQRTQACAAAKTPESYELLKTAVDNAETYRKALAELFGGMPAMISKGKIPDSDIVFLDELFKSGEGLLNSLLTALNERKWTNEGTVVDVPVISFFSASNEIPCFTNPEEKILKPLYDRFDLKVLTHYVQERDNRLEMLARKRGAPRAAAAFISLDELRDMQKAVSAVPVSPDIDAVMDDILCELRRQGVHVSDRKFFGYHPVVRAEAWLNGAAEVSLRHLLVLTPYFMNKPEDIPVIDGVLKRFCDNPIAEKLKAAEDDAAECFAEFEAAGSGKKALVKLRGEYVRLYDRLCALQGEAAPDEQAQIGGTTEKVEALSRKAHEAAGNTYIPLGEIKELSK